MFMESYFGTWSAYISNHWVSVLHAVLLSCALEKTPKTKWRKIIVLVKSKLQLSDAVLEYLCYGLLHFIDMEALISPSIIAV